MIEPGTEEVSWAEVQQKFRENHEVIMDSDSVSRTVRAFEWAYRGESAKTMDLLRDLPVEVLEQISSAAKVMGEMAGYFKQEVEFAISAEKWIGKLGETITHDYGGEN